MEPQYVTISEAAKELGISHTTMWRLVNAKRLPSKWVGPLIVIEREDLDAFKRLNRTVGRPKKDAPPRSIEYSVPDPTARLRLVAEKPGGYDPSAR